MSDDSDDDDEVMKTLRGVDAVGVLRNVLFCWTLCYVGNVLIYSF
jgi:hypothetical protein